MSAYKIPIYIISYNRLDALKKSINSYLKFFQYQDIIIIDNGSDYPPLLEYLSDLKIQGVSVHNNDKLNHVEDLSEKISPIIRKDLVKRKKPPYYIVTDPDILLENVSNDFLEILIHTLKAFPNADVIGPMLTIKDIPKNYPARNKVLQRHIEQFWYKIPKQFKYNEKVIFYQEALIDTTFALHRGNQAFRRLKKGIRLYSPYEAKHLDWYITEDTITSDQLHFLKTTNKEISHWLGSEFIKQKFEIGYTFMYLVENNSIYKYNLIDKKKKKVNRCYIRLQNIKKNIEEYYSKT